MCVEVSGTVVGARPIRVEPSGADPQLVGEPEFEFWGLLRPVLNVGSFERVPWTIDEIPDLYGV